MVKYWREIHIPDTFCLADRVKVSQAWLGHYPSLNGRAGTLVSRAGRFWAVQFEGINGPLLFNYNNGMQQLAFDHVQVLQAESANRDTADEDSGQILAGNSAAKSGREVCV
jgi:hypothetical protein